MSHVVADPVGADAEAECQRTLLGDQPTPTRSDRLAWNQSI